MNDIRVWVIVRGCVVGVCVISAAALAFVDRPWWVWGSFLALAVSFEPMLGGKTR